MTEHDPTARPDRPPTPQEEELAEELAEDVDMDKVRAHRQEMDELGAEVRGEGEILPDLDSD